MLQSNQQNSQQRNKTNSKAQFGIPDSSFLSGLTVLKKYIPTIKPIITQSPHIVQSLKKQIPPKNIDIKEQTNKYAQKFLEAFRRNKARKAYKLLLKNYRYRKSVILELISTEEGYVKDLDIIILQILQPLLESKTITAEQGRLLSSNIYGLRQLNGEFLETMKTFFPDGYVGPYQCIGDLLENYVPFFKLYFQYYVDYKSIDQMVQFLKTQNSKFNAFSVKMINSKEFRYLDVSSFLVKPVQRLPKYVLLFNDLLKHTDPSHPDYLNIKKASKSYSDVTQANNMLLDKVLQNSRLSSLQEEFPAVKIFAPNRNFISQIQVQMFKKDKLKPVYVYLTTDLIIVASRNQSKPKLECFIVLNQQSIVKGLEDYQYFFNLINLQGENNSITLAESNLEAKENTIIKFEEIIQELRDKSVSRNDALHKNSIRIENKIHQIQVIILGTETRTSVSILPYTVYIIEVIISNITQTIYLRYSELLEVQEDFQKLFPKLKKVFLEDRIWQSENQAKEVETRAINIQSFLSTILQIQEFKSPSMNMVILLKLGLPIEFYLLPDILKQEQCIIPVTECFDEDASDSEFQLRMNDQDVNKSQCSMREDLNNSLTESSSVFIRSSRIYQKKIVSSSVLLRAGGQEIDRYQTKEARKIKKDRQISFMINIISFHCKRPIISMKINQDTKTLDLYQKVSEELQLNDLFDFKFLIPISQTRNFRPLGHDEILVNLFSTSIIMETFFNEKKEIYLRKQLYLGDEQEEMNFLMNPEKLNIAYPQYFKELSNYQLSEKEYCWVGALYLFINNVPVDKSVKFPHNLLRDVIPSAILNKTKKDEWCKGIQSMYYDLIMQFQAERIDKNSEQVQKVKIKFISLVSSNLMSGKQFFLIQPSQETQQILKTVEYTIFMAVSIRGIIFFDKKKKSQLLRIGYSKLSSIISFSGCLQIRDSHNKYYLSCPNSYEIKQLVDEYMAIFDAFIRGQVRDTKNVGSEGQ